MFDTDCTNTAHLILISLTPLVYGLNWSFDSSTEMYTLYTLILLFRACYIKIKNAFNFRLKMIDRTPSPFIAKGTAVSLYWAESKGPVLWKEPELSSPPRMDTPPKQRHVVLRKGCCLPQRPRQNGCRGNDQRNKWLHPQKRLSVAMTTERFALSPRLLWFSGFFLAICCLRQHTLFDQGVIERLLLVLLCLHCFSYDGFHLSLRDFHTFLISHI